MAKGKHNLEMNLRDIKVNKERIGLETNLEEFYSILWKEVHPQTKGRSTFSSGIRKAICMLQFLYEGNEPSNFVPRQIYAIGELYSFTEEEIRYGFRGFGRETWIALNKILTVCELPSIQLPQEYTSVLQFCQG